MDNEQHDTQAQIDELKTQISELRQEASFLRTEVTELRDATGTLSHWIEKISKTIKSD